MNRAVGAALAALIASCGNLPTTSEGVAFLQVQPPVNRLISIGDTLQFRAIALDQAGNPIDVPILWRTPDSTLSVDASTGLVVGLSPDSGRVQAVVGNDELVSDFITVFVQEPPAGLRRP